MTGNNCFSILITIFMSIRYYSITKKDIYSSIGVLQTKSKYYYIVEIKDLYRLTIRILVEIKQVVSQLKTGYLKRRNRI